MIFGTPDTFPYLINILLVICVTVGGFFAFRNGKQTQLAKFQTDTITALKERISTLEGKITDVEKENVIQRHVLETITSALKQRGLIITVDGDLVTITDQKTGESHHRKRLPDTARKVQKAEEAP